LWRAFFFQVQLSGAELYGSGVPRMVLDGLKGVGGRLDGACRGGLDSLGFGLVWKEPQVQPAGKGSLR